MGWLETRLSVSETSQGKNQPATSQLGPETSQSKNAERSQRLARAQSAGRAPERSSARAESGVSSSAKLSEMVS